MDDVIKIVESVERLLIDGATETVKHEIKKAKSWISWDYNDTYGCFIDECYNWKSIQKSKNRIRRWISSIISIVFNDEDSRKKSQKSRKKISLDGS